MPGDRASACRGVMDAVAVRVSKKGLQLVHRCRRCGVEKVNRIAEDTDQPDDWMAIVRLGGQAAGLVTTEATVPTNTFS